MVDTADSSFALCKSPPSAGEIALQDVNSSSSRLRHDSLHETIAGCPRDQLHSLLRNLIDADTNHLGVMLAVLRAEQSLERREELYRAIRSVCASRPQLFPHYGGEANSVAGFRDRLTIVAVPEGARQGAGLLTDFHLISRFALNQVNVVRFLPLPARFPKRATSDRAQVAHYPGPATELFKPNDFDGVHFGRSVRFDPLADSMKNQSPYRTVLKAAPGLVPEALAQLHFEAVVMNYFRANQAYFGLESEIPVPSRGPANRVPAWGFDGRPHLKYAAPNTYFNYLDELRDPGEIEAAGARIIRDLMRLARFGIFHTEPAPIYHSKTQARSFLWNVGGLLPGAGDLEFWKESFTHSNLRQSGVADFEHSEHFERWSAMPATVEIVNDTARGPELGFQYHLGNSLFCTLHIMALGYHRLGKSFGDFPEAFDRIMKDAYRAFTGAEWAQFADDIDQPAVLRELSTLGVGQHVGEYCGAYPHQHFIKALYAFTLRAIPEFVQRRAELRNALPTANTAAKPAPVMPISTPDFVHEILRAVAELEGSPIVSVLVKAGLPENLRESFAGKLRMKDVARARTDTGETAGRIAIRAKAIVRALGQVLPAGTTRKISSTLVFRPSQSEDGRSLLELSRSAEVWCT